MAKLKHSEMRLIDELFEMEEGHCLDFTRRTLQEFFDDEFQIDILSDKYSERGDSKANRVRSFISLESSTLASLALRKLIEYRKHCIVKYQLQEKEDQLMQLIRKMEESVDNDASQKLAGRAIRLDLDTVSRDLDRAIDNAGTDPRERYYFGLLNT